MARATIPSFGVSVLGLSILHPRRECLATVLAACWLRSYRSARRIRRSTIAPWSEELAGIILTACPSSYLISARVR
jgi:hypothetical protein